MPLSFFRKSQLTTIITVICVFAAIWLKTFINGASFPFIFDSINMPLYQLVAKFLPPNLFYSKIVTFLIIIAVAIYLLQLNSRFIIIKQRTYLPALFFFLISSALVPVQRINPAVFASLFITIGLDHIFSIYQKHDPLDNLFRAGISLSIASLFYAPAITIYLLLLIGLLILRAFDLREWVVALLGLALPWGFLLLIRFWLNIDFESTMNMVSNNLITKTESSINDIIPIIFTALVGIPTLVALLYAIPNMANQKISIRKYQNLFLWMLLISLLTFALVPTCSYEIAYILAIPLSFQLSNYFSNVKVKFWPKLLFILVFVAAIVVQIYPYL
ncbi:MAG: DUF6427 family protein [Bacteroidales bacterium]